MKVLIVDDEELIRRSLRRVFEMAKHQVFEADAGVEGLKVWRAEEPDVVILDVLMPGLTGPQVIQEMGGATLSKVILMSAYTGEYNLERAKHVGADLFIPKPFQNIFDIVKIAEQLVSK
ncbi:MAG: response regulator [Bdellovibrionales bacterium]